MDDGETATTDGAVTRQRHSMPTMPYTTTPVPEWYRPITPGETARTDWPISQRRGPSKQQVLRVVALEMARVFEMACLMREIEGFVYELLAKELDERATGVQYALVNRIWELLGGDGDGDKHADADGQGEGIRQDQQGAE